MESVSLPSRTVFTPATLSFGMGQRKRGTCAAHVILEQNRSFKQSNSILYLTTFSPVNQCSQCRPRTIRLLRLNSPTGLTCPRRTQAIKAIANRLARIVYRLLKFGQQYVDKGCEAYDQTYREQQVQMLTKRAAELGMHLVHSTESLPPF